MYIHIFLYIYICVYLLFLSTCTCNISGELGPDHEATADWSTTEKKWKWRVTRLHAAEGEDRPNEMDTDSSLDAQGLPRTFTQTSRSSSYTGRSEAMHAANTKRFRY